MPRDDRLVALASFGLALNQPGRLYLARLRWVAGMLDRDVRTIRRYSDAAVRQVAEIAAQGGARTPGWYVQRANSLLLLDLDAPESNERRRVIATTDGLRLITAKISLPRAGGNAAPTHTLRGQMLYGGRIVASRQRTATYFEFDIQLPRALRSGRRTSTRSGTRSRRGSRWPRATCWYPPCPATPSRCGYGSPRTGCPARCGSWTGYRSARPTTRPARTPTTSR